MKCVNAGVPCSRPTIVGKTRVINPCENFNPNTLSQSYITERTFLYTDENVVPILLGTLTITGSPGCCETTNLTITEIGGTSVIFSFIQTGVGVYEIYGMVNGVQQPQGISFNLSFFCGQFELTNQYELNIYEHLALAPFTCCDFYPIDASTLVSGGSGTYTYKWDYVAAPGTNGYPFNNAVFQPSMVIGSPNPVNIAYDINLVVTDSITGENIASTNWNVKYNDAQFTALGNYYKYCGVPANGWTATLPNNLRNLIFPIIPGNGNFPTNKPGMANGNLNRLDTTLFSVSMWCKFCNELYTSGRIHRLFGQGKAYGNYDIGFFSIEHENLAYPALPENIKIAVGKNTNTWPDTTTHVIAQVGWVIPVTAFSSLPNGLADDNWHHIAFSFDYNPTDLTNKLIVTLWIDGIAIVLDDNSPYLFNSDPIGEIFGNDIDTLYFPEVLLPDHNGYDTPEIHYAFGSCFDDFGIMNGYLINQTVVDEIYNGRVPVALDSSTIASNLTAYYKLDSIGPPDIILDSSGTYDGTIINPIAITVATIH